MLQNYQYKITPRRRQLYGDTDALSRSQWNTDCRQCENIEKETAAAYKRIIAQPAEDWEVNNLRQKQEKDDDIGTYWPKEVEHRATWSDISLSSSVLRSYWALISL